LCGQRGNPIRCNQSRLVADEATQLAFNRYVICPEFVVAIFLACKGTQVQATVGDNGVTDIIRVL